MMSLSRYYHGLLKLPTTRIFQSRFLCSKSLDPPPYRICIVGSGPAGFYVAQHLLKDERLHVDILERLPVPFGLVRYGVAPDHADVKNVDSTFSKVAENPRFRFFGNVSFGQDVTYSKLRSLYHGVVLAYGAASSRRLDIPGEHLPNVIPGKDFVGFYNGLPANKDLPLDLECTDTAVIVGVGNVALDIARILLSPIQHLRNTDISEEALEKISKSRITRVFIVGRRGPLHVAFTIKELREMLHLEGVRPEFNDIDMYSNIQSILPDLKRPRKRLTELLVKSALQNGRPTDKQLPLWSEHSAKSWNLRLLRTPNEIHGEGTPRGISFKVNALDGENIVQTEEEDFIQSGLIITSIGYKSLAPPEGIPFDSARGIIPNVDGKVSQGLYVSGWLGTGPKGVIADTMNEAFKVGRTIMKDLNTGELDDSLDGGDIASELKERVVSWNDWESIDSYEKSRSREKPRSKLTSVSSMLEATRHSK